MNILYVGSLIIWNLFVFFLYGLDKFLAKNNMWRISEKLLLTVAFLGGGLGGFCGMKFFHHKTRHKKFTALLPVAALLAVSLFVLLNTNYSIT